MSDSSERDRRDVGDDTRARIDDLKGGWKVDSDDAADDEGEARAQDGPARGRPTPPPPPPPQPRSSADRDKGAPGPPPESAARRKRATRPPPPPPARTKSASRPPPPPPKAATIAAATERDDESTMIHPGSDRLPRKGDPPTASAPTRPSDAPPSLPAPAVQTDRTGQLIDEATALDALDAPMRTPPPGAIGTRSGSVRALEMLPRSPGVIGDMAYFFRALWAGPTLRHEIRNLREQLDIEREGRTQRLIEVARNALADTDLDSTLVGKAREHLVTLEEMRSRHAGAAAAAEEEISSLVRQRDRAAGERKDRREALQEKIASVDQSLAPLQKRQTAARKAYTLLRRTLDELDEKIAEAEDSLVSVEGPDPDAAEVQAQVASLSAERQSVAADEPEIAAELDDLEPKIANLEESRREFEDEIKKLRDADEADKVRVEEKVNAILARRTVEDRAAADLAGERQDALLVLGEAINDGRPAGTHSRLMAIEAHEVKIATLERRMVELRETLANIERGPQLRGALWLLLAAAIVGGSLLLALSR